MKSSRLLPRRGMTLVEVALALGIAAFVIVALVGLLPAGMTSSKEARDEQVATDILLEVENDIRLTPFQHPATPRLEMDLPVTPGSFSETLFSLRGSKIAPASSDGYFRTRIVRRAFVNPALTAWHVVVEWPVTADVAQNRVEAVVLQPNARML